VATCSRSTIGDFLLQVVIVRVNLGAIVSRFANMEEGKIFLLLCLKKLELYALDFLSKQNHNSLFLNKATP
jgi:hypothetical protein